MKTIREQEYNEGFEAGKNKKRKKEYYLRNLHTA
jgi:hypothetical protein